MTLTEIQDLRHAVLRVLALAPRMAYTPEMVFTYVKRWLPFRIELPEVRDAMKFVADLGHAERIVDNYGAEQFYRITAEGTLAHERAEAP